MNPYGQQGQFPFMYQGMYSPGQMAGTNNPELSQLITMFAGPLLGQMAGPGNFVPHMMPTMQMVDQFAARNYQNQTRQTAAGSFFNQDNTDRVSKLFLAGRSAVTDEPASELNKEQARNMAGFVNNPLAKMALSGLIGAEATEGLLHGSKGDISSLGNTLNKIGYFRPSATGESRMNARALDDYTRGTYAHLYEPQGNIEDLEQRSRAKDEPVRTAGRAQLKKAAQAEQMTVVEDDDVSQRLQDMKDAPERVNRLYKKYIAGGKATDTKTQAQELTKIENALKDADILKDNETTVSGLVEKAKRVPVNEMHGFMAGQAGQITDHMFQRGMLPQSIGALSAADRVKAIHGTAVDDETMLRLSRETARRDLGDSANKSADAQKYRELRTDRERDEFVNSKAGEYRKTLDETRKEIEKTATGAPDAKKATDLEKMKGFDALAGNTDSSRSADAIKKYTSAVAAVRDIFGDNGNPNAPLPALLAALEGLTGGAVGSMKPQKIAATLRQMQTLAKEAGVGFDQMAAMSSQIDAQGQMMGLTSADTMRLKPAALAAVKVMQDTGAFSNPVYGQMDKGAAAVKAAEMITRGAASKNSMAMASLESIYKADPARFKDTDLERALVAYRNNEGDGTYTTKSGEKKNIREEIGKGGVDAATRILTGSGGTMAEFTAQINNPAVKEHMNQLFGFLTQPYELVEHINYGDTRGRIAERLTGTGVMTGKTKEEQDQVSAELGEALATMIVDTSGMQSDEQITHIQENIEAKFVDVFAKTMPRAEAEKHAKEAAAAISSRSDINTAIAGANTVYGARTGGEMLSSNVQFRGNGVAGKIAAEAAQSAKRAERRAATAMGYESNPAARGSDYMTGIAERGEKFTLTGLLRAMGQEGSDRELISKYAPDMEEGLKTLDVMRREALVTKTSIADMADKNDIAGLKKLANVADDVKVVGAVEAERMRDAQIKTATGGTGNVEKDNQALAKTYNQYVTGAKINAADITDQKRAEMLQELRANKKFMRDMELDALGSGQTTKEILVEKSHDAIGQAKEGQEQRAADVNKVERAMLDGRNADALREGVFATYRLAGVSLTDEQAEEIHASVADSTPEGKEKLKTALDKVSAPEKSKQIMQKVLGAQQASIPLAVGQTFGIEHIPDKELVKELTKKYEAEGVSPAEAVRKAQEEVVAASGAKQRDDAAGKGVAQKTDKVEISAQTVVIKGDKVDGGGGKTGAPVSAAQPMPNTVAGVTEEMDALAQKMQPTSILGYMLGEGSSYFPDQADKERFAALSKRKQELAAQPPAEGPQPDAPLAPAKPEDAPAAAATAEPEKVKQANEEQLKQSTGAVPAGDAPATPEDAKKAKIVGLKEQQANIIEGMSRSERDMMHTEASYLNATRKAAKAKETGDVKEEAAAEKKAKFEKSFIVAQRAAHRMGLPVGGEYEESFAIGVPGHPGAEYKLGGKKLDLDIYREERAKFEKAEQENENPLGRLSPEFQKFMGLQDQIEAETEAPAVAATATPEPEKVKQANEEQLKQSTGAVPAGDAQAPTETAQPATAPEPEKVKQANEEQLKQSTGAADQPVVQAAAPVSDKQTSNKPVDPKHISPFNKTDKFVGVDSKHGPVFEDENGKEYTANNQGDFSSKVPYSFGSPVAADFLEPGDPNAPPQTFTTAAEIEETEKVKQANEEQLQQSTGAAAQSAPEAKKEEQRYTADELARLHPEEVENEHGEMERWQPDASRRLPDGTYKDVRKGVYVNPKTGEELDRYGNSADGTYNADGSQWEVGGKKTATTTATEPEKVKQANEEQLKQASGVVDQPTQNGGVLSSTNLYGDDVAALAAGKKPPAAASAETSSTPMAPADRAAQTATTESVAAAPLSSMQEPLKLRSVWNEGSEGRSLQELPASYVAKQSAGLQAAPSGGSQSQNLTVNGTLTLSGLQEAILNSRGSQVVQTDGGGAPVVLDPNIAAKTNAAPKTYG